MLGAEYLSGNNWSGLKKRMFSKETVFPLSANNLIYLIRPAIAVILALIVYLRFPRKETLISISTSS